MTTKATGDKGEALACDYLQSCGWSVVGRNVRVGRLEIDIVARRGGVMAAVEVKTRTAGRGDFTPERAMTPAKQARLLRALEEYCRLTGTDCELTLDLIAINLTDNTIAHYPSVNWM